MKKEEIEALINEFRSFIQADGGDLIITGLAEDLLNLTLVIGPTGCKECVMPAESIEELIESNIKDKLQLDYKVHIAVDDQTAG